MYAQCACKNDNSLQFDKYIDEWFPMHILQQYHDSLLFFKAHTTFNFRKWISCSIPLHPKVRLRTVVLGNKYAIYL